MTRSITALPGLRLVRDAIASAEARWFDRTRRVDTIGAIQLDQLTLVGEGKTGFFYMASRPATVRRAFDDLPVKDHSQYTFVDLGSGKGRILCIAAEYPYRRIEGVEFAIELHEQAVRNLSRFRHPKRRATNIASLNMDAVDYRFPETHLVVCLCNPFGGAVLEKALGNLASSFDDCPRHIVLVMMYPEHASVVDNISCFQPYLKNSRYHIYQTCDPSVE